MMKIGDTTLKKCLCTLINTLRCAGMFYGMYTLPLHATASFEVLSNPYVDCEACGDSDEPNCKPEDCRDWWSSVDFFVNGEKVMHGREDLGQNGFKMDNVPEGAEISLGPVGTVKNYTQGEKVHDGPNVFKCSGSFFKNCDDDYICKCKRVQ